MAIYQQRKDKYSLNTSRSDAPLVSVIIPSFNSPIETLEATRSALRQTYSDMEVIIIDDGSLDQNKLLLQKSIEQLEDERVELVSIKQNSGVAVARNIGLDRAKGQFVAFLDSDDLWHKEKLERQIKFHRAKRSSFTFTSYVNVDNKGAPVSVRHPSLEATYNNMLRWNCIGNSTVVLDRNKIGPMKYPNLKRRQDYAFWLLLLRSGHVGNGLQEPLAIRRLMPNSLSQNKFKAAVGNWKVYRDIEKLSVLGAANNISSYFLNSILFGVSANRRSADVLGLVERFYGRVRLDQLGRDHVDAAIANNDSRMQKDRDNVDQGVL